MQVAATATLRQQRRPSCGPRGVVTWRLCAVAPAQPWLLLRAPRREALGSNSPCMRTHLRAPPRPHCRPPPHDTGWQAAWARFFGLPPHPESTPGGRGVTMVSWDRSLAGDTAGKNTTHPQAHEGVLGLTADSQEGKEECRALSVEKAGLPDVGKFPRESQSSGQVTPSLTACQLCLRRAVSSLLSPVSPPMAHLGSTTQ